MSCQTSQCTCSAEAKCRTEHQYSVKVVCGTVPECAPNEPRPPVAPGSYFTAINIHNPSKCATVSFRWKVAQASPKRPGKVSPFFDLSLGPDQALELDCPQLFEAIKIAGLTFLKGYAVIESESKLDVVAVYTGTQGPNWPVNFFHTERVESQCIPVCEDLTLPLNTGVADWRVVATNQAATILPANLLPGGTPPTGSKWISATTADGQFTMPPNNVRDYQLCFNLCYGFDPSANIDLSVIVDDRAEIFLNNFPATPAVVPFSGSGSPIAVTLPGNRLREGQNCILVRVTNTQPTRAGFALSGLLRIGRGRCCGELPILPIPRRRIDVSNSEDLPNSTGASTPA